MSSLVHQHNGDSVGHIGFAGGVKMLGAGAWGLSLAVIGLWVMVGAVLPGFLGGLSQTERVLVGVGMLAGGQLIFLMFVAGRVFDGAPRGLTSTTHWVLLGVGVVCFVLFVGGQLNSGGA